MIHELRTYTLIPGKLPEYLKLNAEVGHAVRGDRYGKLEGHWFSEFGVLNQVLQLRSFADLAERERLRTELAENPEWNAFLARSRPLTRIQENKILRPVVPLTPQDSRGNVYELRWYRTRPGCAAEWLRQFQAILPTREKYMRRVGLWQTEIGPLNEVVHLWAFADLRERAEARAQLGQDPAWQQFLGGSVSLLEEMHAAVLLPSPHSPLQ